MFDDDNTTCVSSTNLFSTEDLYFTSIHVSGFSREVNTTLGLVVEFNAPVFCSDRKVRQGLKKHDERERERQTDRQKENVRQ